MSDPVRPSASPVRPASSMGPVGSAAPPPAHASARASPWPLRCLRLPTKIAPCSGEGSECAAADPIEAGRVSNACISDADRHTDAASPP